MKLLWPALAAAVLVSAGLYGILNAVDHPRAEPEDPWQDAWAEMGLKVQLITVSSSPARDLMFGDGRELMKGHAFDDTLLRRYVVQNVGVQVVTLPKAHLLPEFPECAPPTHFRLRKGGSQAQMGRWGRHILLIKNNANWVPFVGEAPVPASLVGRIWAGFHRVAEKAP